MHRVVLDTVVFVRSLINPHSIWGELIFEHLPQYHLFVSQPVLVEILEVIYRPELKLEFRSIQSRDINRVLQIISQAEVVEISNIPKVSRDPKDDKFLATAQAAQADYLVSADRDLLDLQEYKNVKIVDAETFLRILKRESE